MPGPTAIEEQVYRVEIKPLHGGRSDQMLRAARDHGYSNLRDCRLVRLFFVQARGAIEEIQRLALNLLADPVTESASVMDCFSTSLAVEAAHRIEMTLLPGVTDAAADNLVRAAQTMGLEGIQRAATGQVFLIDGDLGTHELYGLATSVFANPVIQRFAVDDLISPPFVPVQNSNDSVETIDIRDVDDVRLEQISAERRLALNLQEMRAVRDYFRSEGRDPTDAELEMLAQTWSEHCVHKTFKARIAYTGPLPGQPAASAPVDQEIDGLLRTYIRAATERINKPWVRSAFVDNAGIIAFDEQYDLAFKVETHNHPSALEPFGGANTGVGGVIRDVLGVSARPIANTDILCFGPSDLLESALPAGVLHPRRIADGVIHGVEDYGNKMGIPTVNGALIYHQGYTANPLVFCGCLGILPRDAHPTGAQAGDLIVVIGGRTGRDGLRGATFSSMEMDTSTSQIAGSAVQIGNPIQEKQVQEVILRARDEKLYNAITDCGAGGLSSAVGEMGQELGARVFLERVPLKYPGLQPWEVWLSEAQERMVLAVPPAKWARLLEICAGQDVEAINIGMFENSQRLRLSYRARVVADIAMRFLHEGIPQRHLKAVWSPPHLPADSPSNRAKADLGEDLLRLLALPNIRSKEAVIRRYDHEVQAGTVVKPLVGVDAHGPSDSAVLFPLDVQEKRARLGIGLSNGICPAYGEIDPYAMAWAAIDEAVRNLVAVGADPDRIAILDNFCWGNANLPDRLGSLVRCAQGCYDAAVAYETPFISGKDSLNNEYMGVDGQRHAIPGTLLISGLGIVPDVQKTISMDAKQAGSALYVVGRTRDELGGSHFHLLHGISGGTVPQPLPGALVLMQAVHQAISAGLVLSCHDMSEGGLAVSLAEMCIAGRMGARVNLSQMPVDGDALSSAALLFSESLSRFVVEVQSEGCAQFEGLLRGLNVPFGRIGETGTQKLTVMSGDSLAFSIPVATLERAWRGAQGVSQEAVPMPVVRSASLPESAARNVIQHGSPRILILHANGTNRDRDAYMACQLAGGAPEIVHVNQLVRAERHLLDYHMLIVPGGFSYGDDLGAGVLWALDLRHRLREDLSRFIAEGRPVLGICNGFQTLVKSGFLPGESWSNGAQRSVTLTYNESGHFECRWVYLQPNPQTRSLFMEGITEPIYCPVAHGEGRFAVCNEAVGMRLWADGLVALTYANADGHPSGYPANPNGSAFNIAGICNPEGNVLGLMPHPEDHIFPWQHPRWHRGEHGFDGLRLFRNGIRFA